MSGMGEPATGFNFPDNGGGQTQPTNDDSLAEGFLAQIPENEREIVGKYVKQWDAGVTKKFQDIHSRYEPYKNYPDVQTMGMMQQVWEMLQNEPERMYQLMHEQFGTQQDPSGGQGTGGTLDEWGELPPAVVQRLQALDQQGKLLETLAQTVIEMRSGSQQEREDRELENYMNALHSHFGDFDDDFVLAKMYAGMDGEQAVELFNQRFGGGGNSRGNPMGGQQQMPQGGRQPFQVLRGGGAVGQQGNLDPTKLSRQDTRSLVGAMLEQAQRQGQ